MDADGVGDSVQGGGARIADASFNPAAVLSADVAGRREALLGQLCGRSRCANASARSWDSCTRRPVYSFIVRHRRIPGVKSPRHTC